MHFKLVAFAPTGSVPVAALIIERLGSIVYGMSKPEFAERSEVFPPEMIDPSGSIISAATVHELQESIPLKVIAAAAKDE
jgi:hypothetical protein